MLRKSRVKWGRHLCGLFQLDFKHHMAHHFWTIILLFFCLLRRLNREESRLRTDPEEGQNRPYWLPDLDVRALSRTHPTWAGRDISRIRRYHAQYIYFSHEVLLGACAS